METVSSDFSDISSPLCIDSISRHLHLIQWHSKSRIKGFAIFWLKFLFSFFDILWYNKLISNDQE